MYIGDHLGRSFSNCGIAGRDFRASTVDRDFPVDRNPAIDRSDHLDCGPDDHDDDCIG